MATRVVFRTWKDEGEEVIALFPDDVSSPNARHCNSYMHVGQHGAADTRLVFEETREATFAEALPLYRELVRIGYDDLCPVDDIDHQLAYERRLVVLREMEG